MTILSTVIFGTIVIGLIIAHAYFRPNIDFDKENDKIIVHYNWKGKRKTWIL